MTKAQQSEAQRLAAICETKGMFPVADELNRMHARILELEQGKCLHQIAEPAANLTSELADMLERSITGLGHYRNTNRWSEADEEHINECNALLERFSSSDDEREAAPQAVQPALPQGWKPGQLITEEMHAAACKVLFRAHGLKGTPQRMLDAMLTAARGIGATHGQ